MTEVATLQIERTLVMSTGHLDEHLGAGERHDAGRGPGLSGVAGVAAGPLEYGWLM